MGTAKRERKKANRSARLEAAREAQRRARTRRRMMRIGIVAAGVIAVIVLISVLGRRGDDGGGAAATTTTAAGEAAAPITTLPGRTISGETPCPAPDGTEERATSFEQAPPMCIDPAETHTAVFDTTAGTVRVRLDTERTPMTTNNFVVLARYGYYDGSAFFRTDPSIGIIQGGGATNTDSPGYTIPDEGGSFTYSPGDLVMARTQQPNSAGAQFFFGIDDNVSRLDAQGTFVSFGEVTEGLDVLEEILASHQDQPNNPLGGAPDPPVVVNSVRIEVS